jgi:hypothetical protein
MAPSQASPRAFQTQNFMFVLNDKEAKPNSRVVSNSILEVPSNSFSGGLLDRVVRQRVYLNHRQSTSQPRTAAWRCPGRLGHHV